MSSGTVGVIILIISFKPTLQIINGSVPLSDKPYMVYLLKAEETRSPYHAPQNPTGWTCGGSIIHPLYILTSSICLSDMEQVYVISGYRRYRGSDQLQTDPCLNNMRKRVISYCSLEVKESNDTENYAKLYYGEPRWVLKDLATARVDTPFGFHDNAYLRFCSYKPVMIKVNLMPKYEKPGMVAMALGWGHSKFYRPVHDFKDYNEQTLLYTATVIMDRQQCAQAYTPNAESDLYRRHLLESSLCTFAPGDRDSNGVPTKYEALWTESYNDTYRENNNIFYSFNRKSMHARNNNHANDSKSRIYNTQDYRARRGLVPGKSESHDPMGTTGGMGDKKTKGHESSPPLEVTTSPAGWANEEWSMTGKPDLGPGLGNGICQNDHGGPLVTWIAGRERVIGVATAFKVTKRMECKGPYLFVSTACAAKLIACTTRKQERRRSDDCDEFELAKKGLRIVETLVPWRGHPNPPKRIAEDFNEDDFGPLEEFDDF